MKEVLETDDVGHILRTLRENHGYTLQEVCKMIGISAEKISKIERSHASLPNEAVLRMWLQKLGCKENLRQILLLAKQHRINHYVKLKGKDRSNSDLVRIIETYKDGLLSEFDRDLMAVIAR